ASKGKDPVACAVLGFVLSDRHEYAAAIPYLRQSLSVYPYQPKAIAYLAGCYLRLGNHKMAINDVARGLYLMPNSPRLYLAMGNIRMLRHQYALAVATDNIALRFVPHDAHARCALAAALDSLGRWSEAKAQFTRAIAEDPASRSVHYAFGLALLEHGDPGAALIEFQVVAHHDSDYRSVRQFLAQALRQTGHRHQAAALMRPTTASNAPATQQANQ
ncbi:MAG: tetratricopeptide repeat protein, partial [Phycisphaerae bacterium]|nr:tetratricopeptide repeat protein [Phycisphaerae bacterium]